MTAIAEYRISMRLSVCTYTGNMNIYIYIILYIYIYINYKKYYVEINVKIVLNSLRSRDAYMRR